MVRIIGPQKSDSRDDKEPQTNVPSFTQKKATRRVRFKEAKTNNPVTLKKEKRNRDLVDRARRNTSF